MEPNQMNNKMSMLSLKNIIIAIIALLVIGASIWYFMFYKKAKIIETDAMRIAELQKLAESSKPVTATTTERTTELQKLSKSSTASSVSDADRLKELENLAK